MTKRSFIAILLTTVWISLSEFFRNEIILKDYWVEHYANLGLIFPSEPINGVVWGVWSLVAAIIIFVISQKFTFWRAVSFSWFVLFVPMWLVTGNMSVLPFSILYFAVPLSLLEVWVAMLIIQKLDKEKS